MICSVCKQSELGFENSGLELDSKYYCELHYPLYTKTGEASRKHQWPDSTHRELCNYFKSLLIKSPQERTTKFSHIKGTIEICNKDIKSLIISESLIEGSLNLFHCNISNKSYFQNTKIQGGTSIQYCKFFTQMNAEKVELKGITYFNNCIFYQDVHFGGGIFQGITNFQNTLFNKYSSFRDSVFLEYAIFNNVKFMGYCNFSRSVFKRELICKKAEFHKVTQFEHCTFTSDSIFIRSKFFTPPLFLGSKIKAGFNIDKTSFYDLKSMDAYPAYKELRIIFADKHHRDSEMKVYYLEQKSLRVKSKLGLKLLSLAYEITSSYGTSILKPLISIIVINIIITTLYCEGFGVFGCVEFSVKQLFSPFGEWKLNSISSKMGNGGVLKIIASLHSTLNIIMLGFISFGLRWRFLKG